MSGSGENAGRHGSSHGKGVNVLLVMSDQHNPFISSPYGHRTVQTPNMQRLAERGVVYDAAYSPAPLCQPARGAFFSGQRAHQLRCYNNSNIIEPEYLDFPEVLNRQGFCVAWSGKVDAAKSLEKYGFTESFMLFQRKPKGPKNPKESLLSRSGTQRRELAQGDLAKTGPKHDGGLVDVKRTDEALKWLRERAQQVGQPWMLSVNLQKPKMPFQPPPDLWDLYADGVDLPRYGSEYQPAQHPLAQDHRYARAAEQVTEQHTRDLRRGYYGCVTLVDRQLGRLLEALKETGEEERTLVIYASDHGEMLGKFGMWQKGSLYEDSVRIPLIVSGPGFSSGERVRTPVDLLDLQATIFEALKAERPSTWLGAPLQKIPFDDPDRVVFSEYHGGGARTSGYVIRRGPWKLIYWVNAPNQLFNIDSDPDELEDLCGQQPEQASALEKELRAICDPERECEKAEAFIEQQIELLQQEAGN